MRVKKFIKETCPAFLSTSYWKGSYTHQVYKEGPYIPTPIKCDLTPYRTWPCILTAATPPTDNPGIPIETYQLCAEFPPEATLAGITGTGLSRLGNSWSKSSIGKLDGSVISPRPGCQNTSRSLDRQSTSRLATLQHHIRATCQESNQDLRLAMD